MDIKKKIRDWLFAGSESIRPAKQVVPSGDYIPSFYDDPAFRFTLRPATGGYVVEVVSSGGGLKNRQQSATLYIISSGQSLSEELGKIITIETLKN